MLRKWIIGAAVAAAALTGLTFSSEARAENVLKIGSLAPDESPWARVLKVWKKAVKERTGNQVEIRFYWNGTQGDEASMVEKVKTGQLQGVGVTAVGLSKIHKPILALQIPGVFPSWAKLDTARNALVDRFQKGAKGNGFHIIGWSDVGRMHWYSRGFAITAPDSLGGRSPYVWGDDEVHRTIFRTMSNVTPVALGVPEVLPALNSNRIDSAHTPALTCGALQWASRFDHVVTDSHGFMIGALVVSNSALEGLAPDHRNIVIDTGKVAADSLTQTIRGEDRAALERQKTKMRPHALTDAEKRAWSDLYSRVRQRLGQQNVFSPDLIGEIERVGR